MMDNLISLLRFFPDAIRARSGTGHAAPPHRAQRSARPHRLVHRRTPHRRDHRRGRRRQDRRRARRRSPPWTAPGTRSSTCPTPPSACAASTTASSPRSAQPLTHHATLAPQAADALAAEHAERGRTPVVVVEEAHLLDNDQLEAIRMLTNHDLDSSSPFACLLVGQPTLRRRMKLGVLAALDQRIGLRYAMPPMTDTETGSYLRHHLALAGRDDALFSDDAVGLIHQTSRGYPRAVNNLALQALVAAFAADKAIVDESSTRTAIAEVTAD